MTIIEINGPDDIPEDVLLLAKGIYDRVFPTGTNLHGAVVHDPLVVIADAILAERQYREAGNREGQDAA